MKRRAPFVITCVLLLLLGGCGGDADAPGARTAGAMAQSLPAQAGAQAGVQASEYEPLVQQLYVGYYGRPADAGGLAHFAEAYRRSGAPTDIVALAGAYGADPGVKALVDGFGESAESAALYPGDSRDFVDAIYRNLFGRAPDAGGLAFWADAIERRIVTRANGVLSIMAGAQGTDLRIIRNKQAVASAFTRGAAAPALAGSYSGMEANEVARAMLAKVSHGTEVAAFQPAIDGALAALAATTRTGRVYPVVEGLYFQTGSASGYLDRSGEFTYAPGQHVSLSIGAVELASVPAGASVTPFDLDDPVAALNLARILRALSGGGDALKAPVLPTTTLEQAELDSESGAARTLARLDPQALLPAPGAPGVTALLASVREQTAASAGAGGGVYRYFDSSLGDGVNSFLGNGSLQACDQAIPRVSAALLRLDYADWAAGRLQGTVELSYGDHGALRFDLGGATGSYRLGGAEYAFVIERKATARGRIVNMTITNRNLAGGVHACNVENLHLRDEGRANLPPMVAFKVEQSLAGASGSTEFTFHSGFGNRLLANTVASFASADPDGRIVSLTWRSSKGDRREDHVPARYGSNQNSFREQVGRGERVTVSLTAVDDQGAAATREFVINPGALSLDEIVKLLDGKLFRFSEDGETYHYRVDAAAGTISEWEGGVGGGACRAASYKIGDIAVGIDLAQIVFSGGDFTYTGDGYTSHFRQVGGLPAACGASAVAPPPPPTPPPATPPGVPPKPAACEFSLQPGQCLLDPIAYIGGPNPHPDRSGKDDVCQSWDVIGFPVRLASCRYATGSSGYTIVRNNGPVADVCWTIHYNGGKAPERGCQSSMPAGHVSRASCFSCNPANAGVYSITLTRYRVK